VSLSSNLAELAAVVGDVQPEVVMIDNLYEPNEYSRVINHIKKENQKLPVIFLSRSQEIKVAVTVLKAGADTVLSKPLGKDRVLKAISEVLKFQQERKAVLKIPEFFPWFLGCSEAVGDFVRSLERAAEFSTHLGLIGEAGSHFKEIAQVVHRSSPFAHQNFITYNFDDSPSEIDFYQRFSGYLANQAGNRLAPATFCLEGVSGENQKLKTFLFEVLKKSREEQFNNFRFIICAVPAVAEALAAQASQLLIVRIPSLENRRADIPFLVTELVEIYNLKFHKKVKHISAEVLEFFINYNWAGQTREMENVIKAAIISLAEEAETLELKDLPVSVEMLARKEMEKNLFQRNYNLENASDFCLKEIRKVLAEKLGPDSPSIKHFFENC
jgi:two-component system response regulator HydG